MVRPGKHFKAAAALVGYEEELRAGCLNCFAGARRQFGNYRGDNAVLAQAIAFYRAILSETLYKTMNTPKKGQSPALRW
jgi:hypothetical protein